MLDHKPRLKNILIRTFSALIAILVLMGIIKFGGSQGLFIFSSFIVILGILEAEKIFMSSLDKQAPERKLFLFLSLLSFLSLCFLGRSAPPLLVLFLIISISYPLVKYSLKNDPLEEIFRKQSHFTLGVLYSGILPAFCCQIILMPDGLNYLYSLLLIVFTGDVMAYLFGITMGRHKILPNISPKKTFEGCVGGLLGSALAGLIANYIFLHQNSPMMWVLAGLIIGFAAQLGDFFESQMKRMAHIKDSGHIMPGHGGVLDRLDGVYFASPVFFLFISL